LYSPLVANAMKVCACLRIFSKLMSAQRFSLSLIGKRANSSSRKSNGVIVATFHFRRLKINSSQRWNEKKKMERKEKLEVAGTWTHDKMESFAHNNNFPESILCDLYYWTLVSIFRNHRRHKSFLIKKVAGKIKRNNRC
jgi:hypothetical protein